MYTMKQKVMALYLWEMTSSSLKIHEDDGGIDFLRSVELLFGFSPVG